MEKRVSEIIRQIGETRRRMNRRIENLEDKGLIRENENEELNSEMKKGGRKVKERNDEYESQ